MASKLYFRNTTTSGISDTGDGILYDLVKDVPGASVDTSVTNTTASGTQIQATKTAGGSTIAWISGRAPSGGFTLTNTDISAWQVESNMNANIGGRFRVFKRTAAGVVTEVAGGPFDDGVEMNTSDREDLWTGNVTDTAFAENDRILIRYYITNVGTMASGHTGTLKFNAADAATGDSFFNIAETVTFKPNAQTIAPSAIASAQAFGTAKLNRKLLPSAIASAEAVGSHTVGGALGIGDGLVSFWKLNETSGSTRNDSVGANHLSETGGNVARLSPGKVVDAASFVQIAYLSVADNASLSITGSLSVWAWVRIDASISDDFPGIVAKWGSGNQRSYALRYDRTTSRFVFSASPDGTTQVHISADTFGAPTADTWYFVQAYVDLTGDVIGIRIGTASSIGVWDTAAYTHSGVFDSTAALEIGRLGTSGNVLHGEIDAAGLAQRKYSEANWTTLWNSGNGLEVVAPVAKAGFDQTRMELETVFLDGSQSFGDGLSYSWSQISGTSVTLVNPTSPQPNFTAPDVATPTNLVFELEVEEADLDTATDQVTIRVVPTGSTEWLWHTPLEADIDPDLFYPILEAPSMLSPAIVSRNGRIIGTKGDVALEGYIWSSAKSLVALIFGVELEDGSVTYTETVPNSDVPSSPLATTKQFLNMTSDYDLSPHSPGDNFAYNNAAYHHFGTWLKTTFYAGDDHVELLQNALPLNYEDTLTYNTAGFMSGWDGGWSMSTRDLHRIAQMVLQRGEWGGVQLVEENFCDALWGPQIPAGATQSTDETDQFTNQDAVSDIMGDCWSYGFWLSKFRPSPYNTTHEVLCSSGAFGTTIYISREKNLIVTVCNAGGATTNDDTVRLNGLVMDALINSTEAAPSLTIAPSAIASSEALGSTTLVQGGGTITPSGVGTAEAFGTTTVAEGGGSISPSSIGTAEAFGTAKLNQNIVNSGIASGETIGTAKSNRSVTAIGITTAEAFGLAALARSVIVSSITSGEAFGTAKLNRTLTANGIASAETLGATTVQRGAVTISVNGIASAEAFGTAVVSSGALFVTPSAISSLEAFGSAKVNYNLTTSGISSAEAFGTAKLNRTVSLSGITSVETFGPAKLNRALSLSGIASAETFGSAILQPGSVTISVTGIASGETIGNVVIQSGAFFIVAQSVGSAEMFGSATIQRGSVTVAPNSITTSEAFGAPSLSQSITDQAIASGEAVGSPSLHRNVTTVGIASGESIGTASLQHSIVASGIASSEGFGNPVLQTGAVTISLNGIGSAEVFGSPFVTSGSIFVAPAGIASQQAFGATIVILGQAPGVRITIKPDNRTIVIPVDNRTIKV